MLIWYRIKNNGMKYEPHQVVKYMLPNKLAAPPGTVTINTVGTHIAVRI